MHPQAKARARLSRTRLPHMTNRYPKSRATGNEIVPDVRKTLDEQLERAMETRANPLFFAETEDALRAIKAEAEGAEAEAERTVEEAT
jgi:hypothetical protein